VLIDSGFQLLFVWTPVEPAICRRILHEVLHYHSDVQSTAWQHITTIT